MNARITFHRVVLWGALLLFAAWFLLPLYVMVTTSLKDMDQVRAGSLLSLPTQPGFAAWAKAWGTACTGIECSGLKPYFLNSLAMVVPAVAISTSLGALNGYVLSKWRFPGSEVIFGLMLLGVFMPGQIALLPWAFILGKLGLANSVYGLILVHCIQGLSFTTLFCRNYFVGIPDDLVKAARIDGAGFWRIFYKIILPISPPILIVTVIWQFTGIWNEYLFGVVLNSGANQPITSALVALSLNGTTVRTYDVMSAAVLIGALPPLLVYFFGGKYFVRGLTQGAIK